MTLEAIIFLYALVSSIVCDPVTHVYPADCAPPDGFEGNDTGVTTPNYVTLRPIERCCPQCDKCQHLGGFCALKWAVDLYPGCCDFAPVEPCRDYSCKCCIKCGDDKCSPCVETGGECRKDCRSGELEDNKNVCSYSNQDGTGCKCCKKCETTDECTDDYGWCMTDPASCPHGTFASTGCCGGCYCCKPVLEPVIDSACANTPGCYCSETGDDCASGYYACFGECSKTLHHAGLESVVVGYACVPKRTVTRKPPPIPDFCVFDGIIYENGSMLPNACTKFECVNGTWIFSEGILYSDVCAQCDVYNDPHFYTFDGTYYAMHIPGSYTITQNGLVVTSSFAVYGEFSSCTESATCLSVVTFENDESSTITFENNPGYSYTFNVYLNGINLTLTSSPQLFGSFFAWRGSISREEVFTNDCVIILGSQGLMIQYCGWNMYVWAYGDLKGQLYGLCGYYDGNSTTDLTDSNGIISDIDNFAESWEISGSASRHSRQLICENTTSYRQLCADNIQDMDIPENDRILIIDTCAFDICVVTESNSTDPTPENWLEQIKKRAVLNELIRKSAANITDACNPRECNYTIYGLKIPGYCLLGNGYEGKSNTGQQGCRGGCNCWIEGEPICGGVGCEEGECFFGFGVCYLPLDRCSSCPVAVTNGTEREGICCKKGY